MLNVGEAVIYGAQGVCSITGTIQKMVGDQTYEYYVLRPVFNDNSTIFVPVNNKKLLSKMRRVLSSDEIYGIIKAMPDEDTDWIEDDSVRAEKYREIISGGDRQKLVRLIKTMYTHEKELKEKGKKLRVSDGVLFRDAEKLLYEEFAYVLKIDRDQVIPFIAAYAETVKK